MINIRLSTALSCEPFLINLVSTNRLANSCEIKRGGLIFQSIQIERLRKIQYEFA